MGAKKKISLEDSALELSVPERILIVEKIWDSIAEQPDAVPVTKAQRAELDSRLDRVAKDIKSAQWPEVKRRVQSKK